MKKKLILLSTLAVFSAFTINSCKIEGCTDNKAINFDGKANTDDGSCEYLEGCTDVTAINYNYQAGIDDGSCQFEGQGVFWIQDLSPNETITVYYEGEEMGYITKSFNHPPDCGEPETVTIIVEPGLIHYSAVSNSGRQWQDSIYIYKNTCKPIELPINK